ncbi:MAG TPA: NAD(P)/FAD-dependent oxidoreductase [Thermoanaerobaculia bacterium]|nr:NAD(P)/FAD-dependent oxidoreductase [Thermoanaerobaculia bacterium]
MCKADVAIIGAGPAGSTLAALLAQRGVRVTLFDRDEFPRDKLCGEFLSYDALPVLRELGVVDAIDAAGAPHIERCRIVGRRRVSAFALPHPARGVSRMLLDAAILDAAKRSGAHFEVRAIGDLRECEAKIVAGAWGRWGRFDRALGRSFVRSTDRNFGFKRHYRAHTSPANHIDLYSFRRGYLGVNAVEGGITNICGLVHASRLAGHKGRWDAFVETIRREEPPLDALYAAHEPAHEHFLSSDPVIFRARSAVEEGVFMIGDASGVIDPLTGNGMAMAVQSALLAAPRLLRLLESPSQRDAIENEYRRAHHALFTRRLAWSRVAARLLSHPRAMDAALATLRSPKLGALFLRNTRASFEEIDRLAREWFG